MRDVDQLGRMAAEFWEALDEQYGDETRVARVGLVVEVLLDEDGEDFQLAVFNQDFDAAEDEPFNWEGWAAMYCRAVSQFLPTKNG